MRLFLVLLAILSGTLACAQTEITQVKIGNSILQNQLKSTTRNPDSSLNVFEIQTGDDGIITSVRLLTNDAMEVPFIVSISRIGNEITVHKPGEGQEEIRWTDGTISVRGPVLAKSAKDFMTVTVAPRVGVIYESPEIILKAPQAGVLQEELRKVPSRFFSNSYKNGILLVNYKFQNNVNYKFTYRKANDKIFATYYYPLDEDFLKYSPEMEISGAPLNNSEVSRNIINNFILEATNHTLRDLLFPVIFLKDVPL